MQPRALGIALAGGLLAGGLLAELMLGAGIGLRPDGAVLSAHARPQDELTRHLRDLIAAEREPHPIPEWLLYLAGTAAGDVAGRLERSGYLTRAAGRRPWRPQRWVPADPDAAFSPLVRVRSALDPARPLSAHGAVLAGLAAACGLSFRLAQHAALPGRGMDEALAHLNPRLQELVAQTQATVDSAVLSHRT